MARKGRFSKRGLSKAWRDRKRKARWEAVPQKLEESASRPQKQWRIAHIADYSDFISDIAMLCVALKLWLFPSPSNAADIFALCILLEFELVMLHGGTLMSAAGSESKFLLLVLVGGYALFAWVFSMLAGNSFILWLYLGTAACRMGSAMFASGRVALVRAAKASFCKVWIYLGILFLLWGMLKFSVPHLGLSREFLVLSDYDAVQQSSGLLGLPDMPHVALCIGATYFTAMALFDLWLARNPHRLAAKLI